MKKIKSILFTCLCALGINSAFAGFVFNFKGGYLNTIQFTQKISFNISSQSDEYEILLILNDVYQNQVFLPVPDPQVRIIPGLAATHNGEVESTLTYLWLLRENRWDEIGSINGEDPRDLFVGISFGQSTRFEVNDTLVFDSGIVGSFPTLDVPIPDNLKDFVMVHLYGADTGSRLSEDVAVEVIASNVETASLGWIEILKYPYVWSYILNSWLYLAEEAENLDNGSWVYIYNR